MIIAAKDAPASLAIFSIRFRSLGVKWTVTLSDCLSVLAFGGRPVRALSASRSAFVLGRFRLPMSIH